MSLILSTVYSALVLCTLWADFLQRGSVVWFCRNSVMVNVSPFFNDSVSLTTWANACWYFSKRILVKSVVSVLITTTVKLPSMGLVSAPVVCRQDRASAAWVLMPVRRITSNSNTKMRRRQRTKRPIMSARFRIYFSESSTIRILKRISSLWGCNINIDQTMARNSRYVSAPDCCQRPSLISNRFSCPTRLFL